MSDGEPWDSGLFDDDGYPKESALDALHVFEGTLAGYMDLIESLFSSYGFVKITEEHDDIINQDVVEYRFVTGGWSGNESVLHTVRTSIAHTLFWYMSQRGGLEVWRIPKDRLDWPGYWGDILKMPEKEVG